MTKRELVMDVAARLNMTQNEVADIVQGTLDSITEALVEGNRIEVRNFGVFEVKKRDARIGRNPRTGEEVPIPEKRIASFRPGKTLKEWVEAGPAHRPAHLFGTEEASETDSAGSAEESERESGHERSDADRDPDTGSQQPLF